MQTQLSVMADRMLIEAYCELKDKMVVKAPAPANSGKTTGKKLLSLGASALLLKKMQNESVQERDKVFVSYAEPTVNQTLRKHTKLSGIDKHVTYHSSRHTFATLLVIDGVDIYTISKYLGHKSVNMTQRYLKYDLSIAKESAKAINTFSEE